MLPDIKPVIFYDGVCGLCDRMVRFVLKQDYRSRFRFASLQSNFAGQALRRHNANPEELNSVCVVTGLDQPDEKLIARSDAVIAVLANMGGGWRVMATLLRLVPRFLRDWAYLFVARHRYEVFGKYDACFLPEEKYKDRFVG